MNLEEPADVTDYDALEKRLSMWVDTCQSNDLLEGATFDIAAAADAIRDLRAGRDALRELRKLLGLICPELVCRVAHHSKKDQHEAYGTPCPIEARLRTALAAQEQP